MSKITVGSIVRYRDSFIKSIGGIYPNNEDLHGEVTAITCGGKVAKIEWQDGNKSSALLSNIQAYPNKYPKTLPVKSQEQIQSERNLLIAETWSKTE